jgi:hypothetical protein
VRGIEKKGESIRWVIEVEMKGERVEFVLVGWRGYVLPRVRDAWR